MADHASHAGFPKAARKPDLASFLGLAVALGGILGGMIMEGGSLREVAQPTAALIVLGGTLGALMVTTPLRVLRNALSKLPVVFFVHVHSPAAAIGRIIDYASKARKNGIVSLEADLATIRDPFVKKALTLAVDGSDVKEIRGMMELELSLESRLYDDAAKVFTAAGGYAPTIGIIGAVLGLMQVMKNLENITEVGRGIATAFVATVYGVGAANLLFLPVGNKIKAIFQAERHMKELVLLGVIGITEGMNPKLIRSKLEAFESHWQAGKSAAQTAPARD
jgi:chemotaxis protein MotA